MSSLPLEQPVPHPHLSRASLARKGISTRTISEDDISSDSLQDKNFIVGTERHLYFPPGLI